MFYGVGNGHLQMLRSLYPKLRVMARDNVIRVLGDEEQMTAFEDSVEKMRTHILRFNSIGDEDILDIVRVGVPTTSYLPTWCATRCRVVQSKHVRKTSIV